MLFVKRMSHSALKLNESHNFLQSLSPRKKIETSYFDKQKKFKENL